MKASIDQSHDELQRSILIGPPDGDHLFISLNLLWPHLWCKLRMRRVLGNISRLINASYSSTHDVLENPPVDSGQPCLKLYDIS